VPPNTVVAGVPAKTICSIDEYKEKCIQRWKALNLSGGRETWEKQLVEYFWRIRERNNYGLRSYSIYPLRNLLPGLGVALLSIFYTPKAVFFSFFPFCLFKIFLKP